MYIMRSLLLIAAGLAARVASLPADSGNTTYQPTQTFTGRMTWYDAEGGLGAHAGACGQVNSRGDAIVAMNGAQFGDYPNPNNAPICGKKIVIQYQGKTTEATVTDKCPSSECAFGDIDVTQEVFLAVAPELSAFQVTWYFAD